jgi:hypothetical protein
LPEWDPADEDEVVLGDGETDLPITQVSLLPRARLAFYLDGTKVAYRVNLPPIDDPSVEQSLVYLHRRWTELARTLSFEFESALRKTSLLDALLALRVPETHKVMPIRVKKQALDDAGHTVLTAGGRAKTKWIAALDKNGNAMTRSVLVRGQVAIEQSGGQLSRDVNVVVSTPFGLTPIWFLFQGRTDSLYSDLLTLGKALLTQRPEKITEKMISGTLKYPAIKPDSIRRSHGDTLLAIVHHPDVIDRHRNLWPLTTLKALREDLENASGLACSSQPVATLALVGAFSDQDPLLERASSRPSRPAPAR